MRKLLLPSIAALFLYNYAYAAPHSHNGRTHDHPLPEQGIKHRHGNGAYGSSSSSADHTNKNRASTIKTTIISYEGKKIPIDSRYIVRDQNNCIHFNKYPSFVKPSGRDVKSIHWDGKCVGGYAEGRGVTMRYFRDFGPHKNQRTRSPKNLHTRKDLFEEAQDLQDDLAYKRQKREYKAKKIIEEETSRRNQVVVNRDLIKFAKKYGFNSVIKAQHVNATWIPSDRSSAIQGVNGKGKLIIKLDRTYTAEAKIIGEFHNGMLVGKGDLIAYSGKCYKRGFLFCQISENATSSRSITPSSNIKSIAYNAVDALLPDMSRKASRRISSSSRSSSPSSSTQSYCGDNDTCYANLRKSSSSIRFMCTKGVAKGYEKCVSTEQAYNTKYKYGVCGVPYSAHYHSFHEAANNECR